ncbi:MAG: DUF5615 family PIN-like protein [Bacteroidetes bacterium]|nr:DUF5615 family PIN-like protein [Bacteroidota bacterium]MBL6944420.1 DUF5615 family PIN-like protein [Bacteroidales bacterium]
MGKFLIDANLPYHFSLWNNDNFIHVADLDDSLSDEVIWEYAKISSLTIISKDSETSKEHKLTNVYIAKIEGIT